MKHTKAATRHTHLLHEFTLRPQLSTPQRTGTEACIRTWLINYRLLGNLLLGSKQWLHHWHYKKKKKGTHKPLRAWWERNVQASRKDTATCKWDFPSFHFNDKAGRIIILKSSSFDGVTHPWLWCKIHLVWMCLSFLRWKRRPQFSFWPEEQRKRNERCYNHTIITHTGSLNAACQDFSFLSLGLILV